MTIAEEQGERDALPLTEMQICTCTWKVTVIKYDEGSRTGERESSDRLLSRNAGALRNARDLIQQPYRCLILGVHSGSMCMFQENKLHQTTSCL